MPQAVWTGTLSFGLVTLPVRLIPATEPKDVRFHLVDPETGRRVRYRRVVDEPPPTEAIERREPHAPAPVAEDVQPTPVESSHEPKPREVEWDDLARGFDVEPGRTVILSREEVERARPQRSRSIDVEDFVELDDIDPVYLDKSYYVVPQSVEAARPYVVLLRAMERARRIGIGRFVLRTKPHLVAIRPMDGVLALETLFFGDEVRDARSFTRSIDGVAVDDRELELAVRLIEMLKTEWNPAAYSDAYREELLRLIAEKAPVETTVEPMERTERAAGRASAVEELMEALKQSVEAAKERKGGKGKRRAG